MRHVDPLDGILADLDQGSLANAAERQRHHQHESQNRRQHAAGKGDALRAHIGQPPTLMVGLSHAEGRPADQRADGRQHHGRADRPQLRAENVVKEEENAERHHPAINEAADGVRHEENPPPHRHIGLRLDFDAEAMLLDQRLEESIRLVAEVGNLQPVGQHVVAVKPHQRVGVENHRADATDDHQAQAHVVDERVRGRVPPDEGADGGDD